MKKNLADSLQTITKKTKRTYTLEFLDLLSAYKNDEETHKQIYETFYVGTDNMHEMKVHRDFVEKNGFGYGDRPFHYQWKVLLEQMPQEFSFLEIGVFKGQVLSLVQMLANTLIREVSLTGVTPLSGDGDHYFTHPELDYLSAIKSLYKKFKLNFTNTTIIKGFSQEKKVVEKATKKGPFDIVYIDGSHDYEIVVQDINNYSPLVKLGGFLVIDDASYDLNMPEFVYSPEDNPWKIFRKRNQIRLFKGFSDVSDAINETVGKDKRFIHAFACGHNRVWMRVK